MMRGGIVGTHKSNTPLQTPEGHFGGGIRPIGPLATNSKYVGNFVKLFVGSVPRNLTEDEIRLLFAEHGNVLEVALIKDKKTCQQEGCCFIKYATIEEADRAIRALDWRTLPGGNIPIQVRYANGERERHGTMERRLFVGSLSKHATEKEIMEIFAPYGYVDDVYIVRDQQKKSRGCAFVEYQSKEMAMAAMNALSRKHNVKGCDQPLTVCFADPKRPKARNMRPSLGSGHMRGCGVPTKWQSMGTPTMGPPSHVGGRTCASLLTPSGGTFGAPTIVAGTVRGPGRPMNGSIPVPGMGTPPSQHQKIQTYGQLSSSQQSQALYGQLPASQPQGHPHMMPTPQEVPPSLQQQLLTLQQQLPESLNQPQHHLQLQPSQQMQPQQQPRQRQQHIPISMPQQGHATHSGFPSQQLLYLQQQQHQIHGIQSASHSQQQQQPAQSQTQQNIQTYGQLSSSQQSLSLYGQLPASQPQGHLHMTLTPQQVPPSLHQQLSTLQQLPESLNQPQQHLKLEPSQQMQPQQQLQQWQQHIPISMPQQGHATHSGFPSQQLPYLQQQQHQIHGIQSASHSQQQQQPAQSQTQQGYYQVASAQSLQQQPLLALPTQSQTPGSTASIASIPLASIDRTVSTAAPAISASIPAPVTCHWQERKCDLNTVTGEIKYEKPVAYAAFEKQQQESIPQEAQSKVQPQHQMQGQLVNQGQQLQHQTQQRQQEPQQAALMDQSKKQFDDGLDDFHLDDIDLKDFFSYFMEDEIEIDADLAMNDINTCFPIVDFPDTVFNPDSTVVEEEHVAVAEETNVSKGSFEENSTFIPVKKIIRRKPRTQRSRRKKFSSEFLMHVKRCTRCGTKKTPKWRSGPMGCNTLCNACGLRGSQRRL